MVAVTIRNIPDETHRALKLRAKQNGQSTEAEIRAILEDAVHKTGKVGLGSLLEDLGKQYGGADLDIARDKTPIAPASFE